MSIKEHTEVTRLLQQKNVDFICTSCDSSLVNAVEVADALGTAAAFVFKTLVAIGKSTQLYVFMIPSDKSLHMKNAAKAVGEKSLNMLPLKDLTPSTGYVHGGCSPIGMKHNYPTYIDISAVSLESFFFSAGRVGHQIKMSFNELQKVIDVVPADLTK